MEPGTLDRLAELAVNFGANVQPNQQVVIASEVGKEALTRAVAEHAYRAGALHVSVEYGDPWIKRARIEHGIDESLGYGPDWVRARVRELGDSARRRDCTRRSGSARGAGGARQRPAGPRSAAGGRGGHSQSHREAHELVDRALADRWLGRPGVSRPASPRRRSRSCGSRWCTCAGSTPPIRLRPGRSGSSNSRRPRTRWTARGFDKLHFEAPGTDLTIGLLPTSVWWTGSLDDVVGNRAPRQHPDRGSVYDPRSAAGGRGRAIDQAARTRGSDDPRARGRVRRVARRCASTPIRVPT